MLGSIPLFMCDVRGWLIASHDWLVTARGGVCVAWRVHPTYRPHWSAGWEFRLPIRTQRTVNAPHDVGLLPGRRCQVVYQYVRAMLGRGLLVRRWWRVGIIFATS